MIATAGIWHCKSWTYDAMRLEMKKTPTMLRHETLVGKTFGKLTVEKIIGPNSSGQIQAQCICGCGRSRKVAVCNILAGKKLKCGRGVCAYNYKDITGQTFNFLKAIKVDRFEYLGTFWWFDCVCGKRVSLSKPVVVDGKVKSCGCKRVELNKKWWNDNFSDGKSIYNKGYAHHVLSAKKRKKGPPLTREKWEEIVRQPCTYCGGMSRRVNPNHGNYIECNSADRFDNNLQYTEENTVPSCFVCQVNKMKMDGKAYIEHARKVAKHNEWRGDL